MLYNQTFNLDQVSFAAEGLKDAQQTVCTHKFFLIFLVKNSTLNQNLMYMNEYADDSAKIC